MLSTLERSIAHARSWVLTGDESWVDFSYDYQGKGPFVRDLSMMKPKALINTPKIMVLIIWGAEGQALVEIFPLNLCVRTKYSCKFAIPYMEANVETHCPPQGLKGIIFHWDNAPSYTAKVTIAKISELEMNQMPNLPSSIFSRHCPK
jgi:hypothetical protein